ncbi:MAG: hypothetical protein AB1571_02800 [Nanoarchaeota archaeon]
MNKILKLVILIVPLLFIAQCANLGFRGTTASGQGLAVKFLDNQPPRDVLYEGQNFRVGLEIKNSGLDPVKALVCIYDTPADYFGGIPSNVCEQVNINKAEKSGNNIFPEVQNIFFPSESQSYFYRQITKGMSTNILADVYYQYTTRASAQICLKKDTTVKTPGVNCQMSSSETIAQDPAPLTISNLKKDIIPQGNNQILLLLTFNMQAYAGEIFDKEKIGIGAIKDEDKLVDVSVDLKGIPLAKSFECHPNKGGRILFKENQKVIKCQALITLDQDYIVNPVEIKASYGHKIATSTGQIPLVGEKEFIGE